MADDNNSNDEECDENGNDYFYNQYLRLGKVCVYLDLRCGEEPRRVPITRS